MATSVILVVPDLHVPYHHRDSLAFLKELKKQFKPTEIVCLGDEIDHHAISFHNHDPDLLSPGDELKKAIEVLREFYVEFPKVSLIDSNHGSLVYRKGTAMGLSRAVFKPYREILEAPRGWVWSYDLKLMSGSRKIYFHHGKSSAPLRLSKSLGMNVVQGHYHSKFEIGYWANPEDLFWSMHCGCLIDDESLAFAYNKTTLDRPLLGAGIIINGYPKLFPMLLAKGGRWIGKLV